MCQTWACYQSGACRSSGWGSTSVGKDECPRGTHGEEAAGDALSWSTSRRGGCPGGRHQSRSQRHDSSHQSGAGEEKHLEVRPSLWSPAQPGGPAGSRRLSPSLEPVRSKILDWKNQGASPTITVLAVMCPTGFITKLWVSPVSLYIDLGLLRHFIDESAKAQRGAMTCSSTQKSVTDQARMRPEIFSLKFRALFSITCSLLYAWLMPCP